MASLRQKLTMYQSEIKKENEQEEIQTLERIPMARLKDMTIAFGKAKLGKTFAEGFEDQSWTKWFVTTYEKSQKIEHLQFLRYVSLRVEESASSQDHPRSAAIKEPTYLRHSAQGVGLTTMAQPVDPWDPEEQNPDKNQSAHGR